LNDDTTLFTRGYPFDSFEGVTHVVNAKSGRKHQKSSAAKSAAQNLRNNMNGIARNQQGRRGGFHHTRGGLFQSSTPHRGNYKNHFCLLTFVSSFRSSNEKTFSSYRSTE
jgi:hypothetical protein